MKGLSGVRGEGAILHSHTSERQDKVGQGIGLEPTSRLVAVLSPKKRLLPYGSAHPNFSNRFHQAK